MRPPITLALLAILFVLAYGQAPLYYSNQNQYFLHGLAQAGHGFLAQDWLANTTDPTPLFSLLVGITIAYLPPYFFHLYYGILLGLYFFSLVGLFAFLAGPRANRSTFLVFMALIMLIHAAGLRWLSFRFLGNDYPWFFQAGVAGQYILGAMFQPSTMGILLLASLVLFLHHRILLSVGLACLAATIHPTYLVTAGLLISGFALVLWREGQGNRVAQVLALAGLMISPLIVYAAIQFRPTGEESFQLANYYLAHVRIPHHSQVHCWLDSIAVGQLAWVVLSLWLVRKTRVFPILGLIFCVSALLTLLQYFSGSDALALLFPWRSTALLVPVATAIIMAQGVANWAPRLTSPWVGFAAVGLMALLAGAGITLMALRGGYHFNKEERPLLEFVAQNQGPDQVYLIPVRIPNLEATSRGSLSTDFQPFRQKRADQRVIPVDLQGFRLATGMPIYVDFKSIPYKDLDVLEWYQRLRKAESWYKEIQEGRGAGLHRELLLQGITHVVVTANMALPETMAEVVFADPTYKVYRLKAP